MDKNVKVVNKKTGVHKMVEEALATELVGTKEWEVVEEKKENKPSFSLPKSNEDNKNA